MKTRLFTIKKLFLLWLILTFIGPAWLLFNNRVDLKADYRTANRDSAQLAPSPADYQDAVVQVYAARAFNWRGLLASHCWISVKPRNASAYMVYQVVGWNAYRGLPALTIMQDLPDRNWYNEVPKLVLDVRGDKAEAIIPKIDAAARRYEYAAPYRVWPGPNSNSFPAYIGREVPELGLAMPADAVGKDFLGSGRFLARAPSGTGYQFSLFGLFGMLIAKKEGVELNILGLVYGVKFSPFRILLPGMG